MRSLRWVALSALCIAACALSASGQSFTYQGQLSTQGAPANTAHDLEFRVFSAATGGLQIGTTTTVLNVLPVDGVFTATVAPGNNVWTGADRWLEIAARQSGTTTFTTLSPRQKLSPTPYAARSLGERLTDIGSGILTNDGSSVNRLIINRTTPVTGADYFTLRTPTVQQQFGGMYIDTAAGDGYPFYGFSTGGTVRAYAFLEGDTGTFRFYINGPHLNITNTGLFGLGTITSTSDRLQVGGSIRATGGLAAGGTITAPSFGPIASTGAISAGGAITAPSFGPIASTGAITTPSTITASGTITSTGGELKGDNFAYNTQRTRSMYIPNESFQPEVFNKPGRSNTYAIYLDEPQDSGRIAAPLSLPDGAVITLLEVVVWDNSSIANITTTIYRRDFAGGFEGVLMGGSSSGAAPSGQLLSFPATAVVSPVNNATQSHAVHIESTDWQGSSMFVSSVRVTYTVPGPD